MDRIVITEADLVGPAGCERLWGALPDETEFPYSYEEDQREKEARYFGLTARDGKNSALRAGFFVGLVRIGDHVVESKPRFENLDFAKMFAACADDPVVAHRLLDATLFVWPLEEHWIEVQLAEWFTPLLILSFLRALHELCTRHLRRNYVRVMENLTGHIKGRIRVGDHIPRNLARARVDRTVCEYGRFEDDCVENRILRAGLEVSAVFLARNPLSPTANIWIAACRLALSRVSVTRVGIPEVRSARQTGGFRHYRRPIRLAWAVLRHLGVSPEHLDKQVGNCPVPPFALCTYELFERYAEAALRKLHREDLWVGYRCAENNLGSGRYKVRPDFLLTGEREIIDCKYKTFKEGMVDESERSDVYQLVSYSQHRDVQAKLGGKPPEKLTLLYPDIVSNQSKWGRQIRHNEADSSFEIPIERRRLGCPARWPASDGL